MKTKIFFVFMLLLITSILPQKIQAQEKASGSSATFQAILASRAADTRVATLQKYLASQDSPLTPYAADFVQQADLYNIDWKLLVAISGVESTFGKAVPCTNAWGFGIYGDQTLCFNTYDDAIRTISKALRTQYMNQWGATDVYSIGHLYAASPTWADRVTYFMNQIQAFALQPENQPLSISL